jgi:hypothetical protein
MFARLGLDRPRKRRLEKLCHQTRDARVWVRGRVVLPVAQGLGVAAAARAGGLHRAAAGCIVARCRAHGEAALVDVSAGCRSPLNANEEVLRTPSSLYLRGGFSTTRRCGCSGRRTAWTRAQDRGRGWRWGKREAGRLPRAGKPVGFKTRLGATGGERRVAAGPGGGRNPLSIGGKGG